MCGICGIIHADRERPVEPDLLAAMTRCLVHRGPDDQGLHLSANVGLGHRRLSIIDLAGGRQPIYNEDGTCCIVFNGEIYNFHELRRGLIERGHALRTHSDTETILHLYEEMGERCVEPLRGMFAFAIWNERAQELLLARDRVGKKPLFYACDDQAIRFASELKSLLVDPAFRREIDLDALQDYLAFQYVPAPATIFRGARKLPPAHTLVWRRGQLSLRRYWQLPYEPKLALGEAEACEGLREELDEAVRLRLESEVPLGCLLSGGVDSSAVVAFMRRHVSGSLRTFSIGFDEASHNELPYARAVARQFDTVHEEFIVRPDAVAVLPRLVWHCDEPFSDSSALPTYYVAEITRRQVTVALNGDGGDESFAGYTRYLGHPLVRRWGMIPAPLRRALLRPALRAMGGVLPGQSKIEQAQYLNDFSLMSPDLAHIQFLLIFREYQRRALCAGPLAERAARRRPEELLLRLYHDAGLREEIDRKLFTDVAAYLPGDLLVKMDRMTMAHGLEGRSPFLDHKLMEFAARLPGTMKLHDGTLKYILKKALEPILPGEILHRPKRGFGVPLAAWFRNELRTLTRDLLLSPEARGRGFFNPSAVEKLIDDHVSSRQNQHHRLWSLLSFELWCRTFLDRPNPADGPLSL